LPAVRRNLSSWHPVLALRTFSHTIEDLFAHFISRCPELSRYRGSLVASRNQEFAAWNTALESGDEIAFLPPVSGG